MRELKVTQKDDYRMHNKITIKDFSIVSILGDQTYRVCPKGKAKNVTSPLFCMKIFLKDETSLSNYIFYKFLGYNTQDQFINATIPKHLSV